MEFGVSTLPDQYNFQYDPPSYGLGGSQSLLPDFDEYLQDSNPIDQEQHQLEQYHIDQFFSTDYYGANLEGLQSIEAESHLGHYPAMTQQASSPPLDQLPKGQYHDVQQQTWPSQTAQASSSHDNIYNGSNGHKASSPDTVVSSEGQLRSKRAERRAKIIEQHGSVGATDNPKGTTREINGVKEWYDQAQGTWQLASNLDNFRRQIIQEDNARDHYDHEPDRGEAIDDVTTFPLVDALGQKHWNLRDRDSWGNILDGEGNEVMYLVYPPETTLVPPRPGYMTYQGAILLDPDDHPIIDWPGLPRCISSKIEGARLEALRRIFPWIHLPQFRARMPRQLLKKRVGFKPLFGLSSLTQRITRFREDHEIPAWKKSHCSKGADLTQHTLARLKEEGRELHSTAGLSRLSFPEVQRRKQAYKGKFSENRGIYTLTEEQKKEKEEREAQRYAERQEAENACLTQLGEKRKRGDAYDESEEDNLPYKRQCHRSVAPSRRNSRTELVTTSKANLDPRRQAKNNYYHPGPSSGQSVVAVVEVDSSVRDIRNVTPQTFTEQVSIKAALSYTIADYKHWNWGEEPPATSNNASYMDQYNEIQERFCQNFFDPEQAPQLLCLSEWLGSFSSVPVPNVDEMVMKRLLSTYHEEHQGFAHKDPQVSNAPYATPGLPTPESIISPTSAFAEQPYNSNALNSPSNPSLSPSSNRINTNDTSELQTPAELSSTEYNDVDWANVDWSSLDSDFDFSQLDQEYEATKMTD